MKIGATITARATAYHEGVEVSADHLVWSTDNVAVLSFFPIAVGKEMTAIARAAGVATLAVKDPLTNIQSVQTIVVEGADKPIDRIDMEVRWVG
jgi:hypothetical protein